MKDASKLITRRHPLYVKMLPHWNFLESTYEGGRAWFKDNIFRYLKEGDKEYADRVERAYRFNHTRQVVDLVDKYLFRIPVSRNVADAPSSVADFWHDSTMSGLDIDAYARRISNMTSRFGRVWVVIDCRQDNKEVKIKSRADEKKAKRRVYSYIVKPQDALDMSYDDCGGLNWILLREFARLDEDPLKSDGEIVQRFRLWTRTEWFLLEQRPDPAGKLGRSTPRVALLSSGRHDLGIVPVVQADHVLSEEPYESCGLIDDIAYLDRANANYMSNLDAIIQDQTFSQLTIPAQALTPGDDAYTKVIEMGTKRIFTYNGESSRSPEYISPDPKQAEMILVAVGKIVNEIYHSVGLSGERTKDDNGGGIDNASGVAKAYDFERVNSLLTAKAKSMQTIERQVIKIVAAWQGQDIPGDRVLVQYPEKFDTRSLYDEFEIATRLSLLAAPDDIRREQMKQVANKLWPAASKELEAMIEKALEDWPPEPIIEGGLTGTDKAGGAPNNKNNQVDVETPAKVTQKTAKEMAASKK